MLISSYPPNKFLILFLIFFFWSDISLFLCSSALFSSKAFTPFNSNCSLWNYSARLTLGLSQSKFSIASSGVTLFQAVKNIYVIVSVPWCDWLHAWLHIQPLAKVAEPCCATTDLSLLISIGVKIFYSSFSTEAPIMRKLPHSDFTRIYILWLDTWSREEIDRGFSPDVFYVPWCFWAESSHNILIVAPCWIIELFFLIILIVFPTIPPIFYFWQTGDTFLALLSAALLQLLFRFIIFVVTPPSFSSISTPLSFREPLSFSYVYFQVICVSCQVIHWSLAFWELIYCLGAE